jgi:hypothetical protein
MKLHMALGKLTSKLTAYNMKTDGLSHYKKRLCKLCYSRCGDDEWQEDLYCCIYNDAVSSKRVIEYSKIKTKTMERWKGLERKRFYPNSTHNSTILLGLTI